MNFHRCTGILSVCRPRLFSLSDLNKQFTKRTEHPHLTTEARLSSEKLCAFCRSLCVSIHAHSHVWTCTIHTHKVTSIFSGRNCYSQNFNVERYHFLQYIVKFYSNIASACYQYFITYTPICVCIYIFPIYILFSWSFQNQLFSLKKIRRD